MNFEKRNSKNQNKEQITEDLQNQNILFQIKSTVLLQMSFKSNQFSQKIKEINKCFLRAFSFSQDLENQNLHVINKIISERRYSNFPVTGQNQKRNLVTCQDGVIDNNNCMQCSLNNQICGGQYSQNISDQCYEEGFLNYSNNICTQCQNNCRSFKYEIVCDQANGWYVYDNYTCQSCAIYNSGKCGGSYLQDFVDFCILKGYYNYDSNNCSFCETVIDDKCGRSEIQDRCKNNGWSKYNQTICKNCSADQKIKNGCVCHTSCNTCSDYFDPKKCTSCPQGSTLYQNQCLKKCPNGYIQINQVCQVCTDEQMPTCQSCFKTCLICDPFEISLNNNECTVCSPRTRQLSNGKCICQNIYDTRQNFYECSHDKYAVLDVVLSNQDAILTIEFGKKISIPNNFLQDQPTSTLCLHLFADETYNLIGSASKCSINPNDSKIVVQLGLSATIFTGDFVKFNPNNQLSFPTQNSNILIEVYFNNLVIQQQLIGQSNVDFNYASQVNSCSDIFIEFSKITNDAKRGFKSFTWSIQSFTKLDKQNSVQEILDKATNKNKNLFIPKGLILEGEQITIRFSYKLKANLEGFEDISISVFAKKKMFLYIQSSITTPFYRSQSGSVDISWEIKKCKPEGDVVTQEPINFSLISTEFPDINYSNPNNLLNFYAVEFQPFTLNIGTIVLNINAKLVSDLFVEAQESFEINIQQAQLQVKIIGGNGLYSYKKEIIINSKLRDPDIQSESSPQGINIQWLCTNLNTQAKCLNEDKSEMIFPQLSTVTIEANTFDPYTIISLNLIGTKPIGRTSNHQATLLFSEFDLPPLDVVIILLDLAQESVNLNEEIFVELKYDTKVNVDLLSFSGTISYEDNVVGIIKFDYTSLRFQIWNYFSKFNRGANDFEIRFNVFNPQYYMPSMFKSNFKLNFPPNKCNFMVTPQADGLSIETKFLLIFDSCEDENLPIQYQFFYYKTIDDFEFEKKNPHQVKRRQITDKSSIFSIMTLLPPGNLLLLAQAIDSKGAIYNSTIPIVVQKKQYDEQSYLSIIQQKLDQINKVISPTLISDLSIICDDIFQRTEFKSSSSLNTKKIEIQSKLISLQQNLSPLSTFQTVIDKAITILNESGITYNQNEQKDILTEMMKQLDDATNFQQTNLIISKEKLKQKLYDSFQVVDVFSNFESNNNQNTDHVIEFADKIGESIYKNILPNEDPIVYKGEKISLLATQITEKYTCQYFLCSNSDSSEIDSKKQTSISNFKRSEQKENPYSQDESFSGYVKSLKQQNPEIEISKYPIITPSISSSGKGVIEDSFSKSPILTFQASSKPEEKNMTCISKQKEKGWTQKGCSKVYNQKSNSYLCICDSLSPTTVIDDLQELINNKNLDTAFSSDGIENISNFKEFYKYVAFWLLLTLTVLFLKFYFVGQGIDKLDIQSKLDKVNYLNQLEKQQSPKSVYSKNQIVPLSRFNSIQKTDDQIKLEFQKQDTQTPIDNFSPILRFEEINTGKVAQTSNFAKLNVKSQDLKSPLGEQEEIELEDKKQETIEQTNENLNKQLQDTQIPINNFSPPLHFEETNTNKVAQTSIFSKLKFKSQDSKSLIGEQEEREQTNIQKESNESPKENLNKQQSIQNENLDDLQYLNSIVSDQIKDQSDKKDSQEESKEQTNEYQKDEIKIPIDEIQNESELNFLQQQTNQNIKKFTKLPGYKQIALFHNFFGIFFLYNPDVPRPLRFLIFYVRSIHSLCISVIYDQNYSVVQQIGIAVINAISVIIVLKILEKLFSLKSNFGKYASRFITLSVLLGYYYMILSIVSGQTPSESNSFFKTFSLFYFGDILVISLFSAVCQKMIAKHLLTVTVMGGFSRILFKLMQLKLVLISSM